MSPAGGGAGRARRASRRGVRRALGLALVIAGGVAIVWAWRARTRPPAADLLDPVRLAAATDSFNARAHRREWGAAAEVGERLLLAKPRDYAMLFDVATILNNRGFQEGTRFQRPRPALRLSLERIAIERRVIALLDSAAALAPTDRDWADAFYYKGLALEQLGLPLEAQACYHQVRARVPTYEEAVRRDRWLRAHLAEPGLPDEMSDEDLARYPP